MNDSPTSDDEFADLLVLAMTGTDAEWSAETGNCGGCGDPDCHEGVCDGDVCRRCSVREAS